MCIRADGQPPPQGSAAHMRILALCVLLAASAASAVADARGAAAAFTAVGAPVRNDALSRSAAIAVAAGGSEGRRRTIAATRKTNAMSRLSAAADPSSSGSEEEENEVDDDATRPDELNRRDALSALASASALAASTVTVTAAAPPASALDLPSFLLPPDQRSDDGQYKQARRATAYLVDTTIPPTLVPFRASREAAILKQLGQGSGTPKTPLLQERLNLNNIMNKAVFGTGKIIGDLARGGPEDPRSGVGYASFIFLGLDYASGRDAELAERLLGDVLKPRVGKGEKAPTALGLAFAPRSTQGILDGYLRGEVSESDLVAALTSSALPSEATAVQTYLPLIRTARSKGLTLLALAPEPEDVKTVRTKGLQSLDVDRRGQYVVDAEGFIALTQDPAFRLYADKSLLRDYDPSTGGGNDSPGDYFAERILVHEACATAAAQWASSRPDALVAVLAPTKDLRYMGGINGRVKRIANVLQGQDVTRVDEQCVTTILLNPTAQTTLSASKFLRLEIGTSPENRPYQTKVADYLWFSTMPKVNMLPRMMNYA